MPFITDSVFIWLLDFFFLAIAMRKCSNVQGLPLPLKISLYLSWWHCSLFLSPKAYQSFPAVSKLLYNYALVSWYKINELKSVFWGCGVGINIETLAKNSPQQILSVILSSQFSLRILQMVHGWWPLTLAHDFI